MERYTIAQRTKIVFLFIENHRSIINTQRAYRRFYGVRTAPTGPTIRSLVNNFAEYGTVGDSRRTGRPRTGRSAENIDAVRQSVEENPETSTRRRSSQLQLSDRTLRRILKHDLHLFPYKIQLVQKLNPEDFVLRLEYARAVLNLVDQNENFLSNLMMTDEAHFHLNGFVNKQNNRFWGSQNPKNLHQKSLHAIRVTVWCGITAQKVYGPFFFENDQGVCETINGERYRVMLQNFLFPQLPPNANIWFQQDGATAHTARATMDLLRQQFPNRIISKNGDLRWPPRSPDLTAPDFFLWGYLKDKVYVNKPQTLQQLKDNIQEEIDRIPQETLNKVMENAIKRAHFCVRENGSHLTDIIFHN